MLNGRLSGIGAGMLALVAAAGPLRAQAAPAAKETVQLAFGYECEDRFMIRNDGGQGVALEYGVQGGPERSKLYLASKESIEISSASNAPVELWVNGKIAATERKGNRACASQPASQASPDVIVRPLETRSEYGTYAEPYYPREVVYVTPRPYYASPYPYYAYPYPYYGYRSSISIVLPFGRSYGGYTRVIHTGRPTYGRVVGVAHGRGHR